MTQKINENLPVRFLDMKRGFSGGRVEAMIGNERVTLTLTPADVHDASELPEYLFGYRPFKYRATEMSPVVLVDKDTDKYRTFDKDNAFQLVEVKASLQSAPPEVDANSALSNYTVKDRFIGSFIPTTTEANASYDARKSAGERCANAIYADIEKDICTLLGTSTNWDSAVRTAATAVWSNTTTGKPITDVMNALEASYQEVREIWFNDIAAHLFIRHPETKDHMRQFYGDGAPQINPGADFTIPGIEAPFKVIKSRYATVAGVMTRFLGAVAVLISGPPTPPSDGQDVMSSITWRRRGPSGTGWQTREWFVDGRGPNGGTMIVVSEASHSVVVSNVAGGIITGLYT